MSDIALIMNGFLGLLLIGALALGWRLEGRLKALRASHQSFAKAVADLDRAAARAEQGLADLRAATDEAAETLAGRIDRAGGLAARLERLTAEATNVEAQLAAAPRPAVQPATSRDSAFARFAERYGAGRPGTSSAPAARTDLILEDDPKPASAMERLDRLRALMQARSGQELGGGRLPAPADDELFDEPEPRRSASGGGR